VTIPEDDPRVARRPSRTYKFKFAPVTLEGGGCGNVYPTVDETDEGLPFRTLIHKGHAAGCQQALLNGIARLLTLIQQESSIPPERVCHTLIGINCGEGMKDHWSCLDALARAMRARLKEVGHGGDQAGVGQGGSGPEPARG